MRTATVIVFIVAIFPAAPIWFSPAGARDRSKIVFIHGCFWHGHDCARGARIPKSNTAYWIAKIARNRERHVTSLRLLSDAGWKVLTLWECQLGKTGTLPWRIKKFLG
jgi:DNA mismatch endonuclease (patch repair protein)